MNQRRREFPQARRGNFSRRRAAASAPIPVAMPTPHITRYVVDGFARPAPDGVGVDEALAYADSAADRMALFFYPAPGPETIREFSQAWQLHPLLVEDLLHANQRPVVDAYVPVRNGLATDREQIERQVFGGDPAVAERIYRLSQEAIDVSHATSSMVKVLSALRAGFGKYDIPDELRAYLQDVADHLTRIASQVSELREALTQILTVNGTLVAQRQNEDMKKISGWAAILFAPTLIAAVYGMNFDVMPELHWLVGYPMAVALMVAFAGLLYWIFKRSKWM